MVQLSLGLLFTRPALADTLAGKCCGTPIPPSANCRTFFQCCLTLVWLHTLIDRRYPTFTAWIKDVASNKTSNVRMVQADAATIYVYALNATVLNPPNATNTNSVWTRVGPALPSKY